MTPSSLQRQLLHRLAQQIRAPSGALPTQCHRHHLHQDTRFPSSTAPTAPLSRRYSTSSTATATPLPDDAQAKPPRRRRRPRVFSAIVLLLLGAVSGTVLRTVLSPPPPPLPGSPADEDMKKKIRKLAEDIPIVKELQNEPGCMLSPPSVPIPISSFCVLLRQLTSNPHPPHRDTPRSLLRLPRLYKTHAHHLRPSRHRRRHRRLPAHLPPASTLPRAHPQCHLLWTLHHRLAGRRARRPAVHHPR